MSKSTRSSMAPPLTMVDSGGLFALMVDGDPDHARACEELARCRSRQVEWVTSDYVLDETATLLRSRRRYGLALDLLRSVGSSEVFRVEWITPKRFEAARRIFERYRDQDFSFTDCVSFALMRELRISSALTTDAHFDRMGFQRLLG